MFIMFKLDLKNIHYFYVIEYYSLKTLFNNRANCEHR